MVDYEKQPSGHISAAILSVNRLMDREEWNGERLVEVRNRHSPSKWDMADGSSLTMFEVDFTQRG